MIELISLRFQMSIIMATIVIWCIELHRCSIPSDKTVCWITEFSWDYVTSCFLVGTTDKDGNYLGVQVVICKERDFRLPGSDEETRKDEFYWHKRFNKVTIYNCATRCNLQYRISTCFIIHLLLGTFTYDERGIVASSIKQNEDKIKYIDTRRPPFNVLAAGYRLVVCALNGAKNIILVWRHSNISLPST